MTSDFIACKMAESVLKMHNYAGDPFLVADGQVWKLTFHFLSAPVEKAKGHSCIFFSSLVLKSYTKVES